MKLTRETFDLLATYAFSARNPGYKPAVREAPNGDGVWDEQKEYAHIAPKYFTPDTPLEVRKIYDDVLAYAEAMCLRLGLPDGVFPGPDSTLRLLRYPPGATTAPHTDFDLFTLSLYRSHTNAFAYLGGDCAELQRAREISPGIHFGELMTEITGVPATEHETWPLHVPSVSAVFFVIPPHEFVVPSGVTVGEWIKERVARSRRVV